MPVPIVLVHGAWVNAAAWEPFADRLRAHGYDVVTPSWPGDDADPAPAKGIVPTPRAFATSAAVLVHPHAVVRISERAFAHTFANGMSPDEAEAAWTKWTVPTPSRPFFQVAFSMFGSATHVDWDAPRAPLLVVAGGEDRTVPPSMIRAAWRRWSKRNAGVTGWKEYPEHSHFLIAEPGYEQVADDTLAWVEETLGLPRTAAP
jgi:alpha-beta hydrolase superfamily lysophospholipase